MGMIERQRLCQTTAKRPLLPHRARILLYSMLAENRLFYSGCGCFLKKINLSHTFCFDAPGVYLTDLNGKFSWVKGFI